MKNWYQIDRRQDNGELDRTDMIKAKNFDEALKLYFKEDFSDYDFEKKRESGSTIIIAKCEIETSAYWEITRRHEE